MPSLEETVIRNRHRVQPNHANNYQTAHGGIIMKWMDEDAAMSAMRFAGETCVTAAMDGLDFKRPVQIGDIALVEAYAYQAGKTSVKVYVRVRREDPRTGETEETTDGHFTFVALADGKPTGVPELTVDSEAGEQLSETAARK